MPRVEAKAFLEASLLQFMSEHARRPRKKGIVLHA
jgi:hypothetical protein